MTTYKVINIISYYIVIALYNDISKIKIYIHSIIHTLNIIITTCIIKKYILQYVSVHTFWKRVAKQHHINECYRGEQHAPVLRYAVTLFKNEYHDKIE